MGLIEGSVPKLNFCNVEKLVDLVEGSVPKLSFLSYKLRKTSGSG